MNIRYLDICEVRFGSPDICAEDYFPTGQYMYCAGNPVMFTDPTGNDIAILLEGVLIGHLAILIQNEEGKWLYYSINGVESSSNDLDRNDVGIEGNWNSPEEFIQMSERKSIDGDATSYKNLNHFNYTDAYIIKTTSEQDKKISETFSMYAKTKYDPLNNNCAIIVQRSVISGGIKIAPISYSLPASPQLGGYGPIVNTPLEVTYIQPDAAFASIMKANRGRHIKK